MPSDAFVAGDGQVLRFPIQVLPQIVGPLHRKLAGSQQCALLSEQNGVQFELAIVPGVVVVDAFDSSSTLLQVHGVENGR